jgi:hypothetical protein
MKRLTYNQRIVLMVISTACLLLLTTSCHVTVSADRAAIPVTSSPLERNSSLHENPDRLQRP